MGSSQDVLLCGKDEEAIDKERYWILISTEPRKLFHEVIKELRKGANIR